MHHAVFAARSAAGSSEWTWVMVFDYDQTDVNVSYDVSRRLPE